MAYDWHAGEPDRPGRYLVVVVNSERGPRVHETILYYDEDNISRRYAGGIVLPGETVSHWMPYPEPPEVKGERMMRVPFPNAPLPNNPYGVFNAGEPVPFRGTELHWDGPGVYAYVPSLDRYQRFECDELVSTDQEIRDDACRSLGVTHPIRLDERP